MRLIATLFVMLVAVSCGGPTSKKATEVDVDLAVKTRVLGELDAIQQLVDDPNAAVATGSRCKILNRVSKIVKNYLAPDGGPEAATKALQSEIKEEIKDEADSKADSVQAKTDELNTVAQGQTPEAVKADPEILAKVKALVEKLRMKITDLQGKLGGKLGDAAKAAGACWDYLKDMSAQASAAAAAYVGQEAIDYVKQTAEAYKLKTDSSLADMLLSGLGSVCTAAKCQACGQSDDFCVDTTDKCR